MLQTFLSVNLSQDGRHLSGNFVKVTNSTTKTTKHYAVFRCTVSVFVSLALTCGDTLPKTAIVNKHRENQQDNTHEISKETRISRICTVVSLTLACDDVLSTNGKRTKQTHTKDQKHEIRTRKCTTSERMRPNEQDRRRQTADQVNIDLLSEGRDRLIFVFVLETAVCSGDTILLIQFLVDLFEFLSIQRSTHRINTPHKPVPFLTVECLRKSKLGHHVIHCIR
jgi:hypothetical protein